MSAERELRIGEVAKLAGTTPRTIRYYTGEGLLPPPDLRGKYALYSHEHVRRLELIRRLKEAFLPLNEIRLRLTQLSDVEVQRLLAEEPEAGERGSPALLDEALAIEEEKPASEKPKPDPFAKLKAAEAKKKEEDRAKMKQAVDDELAALKKRLKK